MPLMLCSLKSLMATNRAIVAQDYEKPCSVNA